MISSAAPTPDRSASRISRPARATPRSAARPSAAAGLRGGDAAVSRLWRPCRRRAPRTRRRGRRCRSRRPARAGAPCTRAAPRATPPPAPYVGGRSARRWRWRGGGAAARAREASTWSSRESREAWRFARFRSASRRSCASCACCSSACAASSACTLSARSASRSAAGSAGPAWSQSRAGAPIEPIQRRLATSDRSAVMNAPSAPRAPSAAIGVGERVPARRPDRGRLTAAAIVSRRSAPAAVSPHPHIPGARAERHPSAPPWRPRNRCRR